MKLRICFLSILSVLGLISCADLNRPQSSSISYDIVSEQEIELKDCLSQNEDAYLVFFHSDTCNHCKEIMGDVVLFATENITKTYFLNLSKPNNKAQSCSEDEIVLGVDKVEDLYIVGTPTIIKVENGMTTANVAGKEKCLTLLNEERKNDKN